MTITDERVFFPEKMSERVSKEILALYSDPRWLSKSCTALMWTAHLMAVELTERRELDATMNERVRDATLRARCRDEGETMTRLEKFALAVLEESRDELADLDGGWLQDTAEEFGLLVRVPVTEPCGEACRCEDFPTACLRYSPQIRKILGKRK